MCGVSLVGFYQQPSWSLLRRSVVTRTVSLRGRAVAVSSVADWTTDGCMGGQRDCYVTQVGGWSSFCVCVCVFEFPRSQVFGLG